MRVFGRRASSEPQRTGAKESEAREARDPYLAHDLMDGGRSLSSTSDAEHSIRVRDPNHSNFFGRPPVLKFQGIWIA